MPLTLEDFKRLIRPIQNKIFLTLGRALLALVNNAEGTQKLQITALEDETITDVERFQEYGFETYPLVGAEIFSGFLNGNRDLGIILCVHDRRYRPKDLAEGDVRHYDYRGNKITCQSSGIEVECLNGNKVHLTNIGIKMECLNGNIVEMIAGEVKVNGTNLEVLL